MNGDMKKGNEFILYPGLHKIEDLIFLINKSSIGKKGLHYQKLLKDWRVIIGDTARYTIPIKISSNRAKSLPENILYIAANNAAVATELVYQVNILKEQINFYFGYPYIHQIKIIQSVFQVQKIKELKAVKLSENQKQKAADLVAEYTLDDEIKTLLADIAASIAGK